MPSRRGQTSEMASNEVVSLIPWGHQGMGSNAWWPKVKCEQWSPPPTRWTRPYGQNRKHWKTKSIKNPVLTASQDWKFLWPQLIPHHQMFMEHRLNILVRKFLAGTKNLRRRHSLHVGVAGNKNWDTCLYMHIFAPGPLQSPGRVPVESSGPAVSITCVKHSHASFGAKLWPF